MSTSQKDGGFFVSAPYEDREALKLFVAAAITLGALPKERESYLDRAYIETGRKVRSVFWFFAKSNTRDGKYKLTDLYKWWTDDDWIAANPDHELTALWYMALNLRKATEHEAICPPKAMLIRGSKHLLISTTCPPGVSPAAWEKTKAKAYAELEK